LDQNKWIDLARAAAGRPVDQEHTKVLGLLQDAVAAGRLTCPLSVIHCVETWRISNTRRRADLARIMVALSQRVAVSPISKLIRAEAEGALHALGAFSVPPPPPEPFGTGLAFACGLAEYVDLDVYQPDQARMVEFLALATGDTSDRLAAATAERSRGSSEYARTEERYADGFREGRRSYGRTRARISLGLQIAERDLIQASIANDVPLEFYEGLGTAGVLDLLSRMPAVWTLTQMRAFKLEDPQHSWKPNDLNDVKALSVASAYCDVVVAEKAWTHFLKRTDLAERTGVKLLTSVAELAEYVQ
jgi:hypothetical protein